jgi:hypothetical protein
MFYLEKKPRKKKGPACGLRARLKGMMGVQTDIFRAMDFI